MTVDATAHHALTSLFSEESEGLGRVAARAFELNEARFPGFDAETTAQFVHGFATVVREALAGESRDVRDLYHDSAVQVMVAEGRSLASLASQLVTFSMLLIEEVAAHVDPEAREGVITWLASFMGEWSQELVDGVAAGG